MPAVSLPRSSTAASACSSRGLARRAGRRVLRRRQRLADERRDWLTPIAPTTVGVTTRVPAGTVRSRSAAASTSMQTESTIRRPATSLPDARTPTYRRTRAFAEIDSRTSPGYTRSGGLYRVDWSRLPRRPTRGTAQLPRDRRRGAAVHPGLPRELGHRAARARLDDDDRAGSGRAVSSCCRTSAAATRCAATRPGASATATGCC